MKLANWKSPAAARSLVAMVLLLALLPSQVSAAETIAGASTCASPKAGMVVYALNGSIYRVGSNGRNRCRLSRNVGAEQAAPSPDGRIVAFLSATTSSPGTVVKVLKLGAKSTLRTVRGDRGNYHAYLTWSPNSRRVAFVDGTDVWIWSVTCDCSRLLSRTGQGLKPYAWSPDAHDLAIGRFSSSGAAVTHPRLTIANLITGSQRKVTIRFPGWIRASKRYFGWFPSQIIGWRSDGDLLIGTSGFGVGLNLTSIWQAPSRGGTARMIVGTRPPARARLRFPLLNSTMVLMSPDRKKLVLDPDNRFWITSSSGTGGHLRSVPGCLLSQGEWIGNSQLAAVTVCQVRGRWSNSAGSLARLYSLPIGSGGARLLASGTQEELFISEGGGRCVQCGGG